MKKVQLFLLIAILCLAISAEAFDGNRKGFVLGGGLGIAPSSGWKTDFDVIGFPISVDETGAGVGVQLVIGGAFNEKNMLVYEGNVTAWNSDFFDKNAIQGFNGISWYHYLGNTGKSGYFNVGIGAYRFEVDNFDANDLGGALMVGGGYEFSKHWQIGASLALGSTKSDGIKFDHHHFSILISGIAY